MIQSTKFTTGGYWRKFLLMMIVYTLLAGGSCQFQNSPSAAKIRAAQTAVAKVHQSIYVPLDAVLLVEKRDYGTNPRDYPDCVRGFIYQAYSSPRTFEKVLNDYRERLAAKGWEPSPDYRHDDNSVDVFQAGPQLFLALSANPLRWDLLATQTPVSHPQDTRTIYYLELSYYDPSKRECSEG